MMDEKDLKTSQAECNCNEDSCCKNGNNEECCCGHDHGHEDCCCDHDHEYEEIEVPVVTIENEDGTTEELEVVEEFEYNGNSYILVQNSDETVTPLKVSGEEGELEFLSDEEFEEVSKAFSESEDLLEDEDEEEEIVEEEK